LAARTGETAPDLAHGFYVIGPLVDQGDVMPGLGQHPPHDAADRSHSDDADACAHEDCPFLKAGMIWAEKRSSCSRITACGVPTTCPTLTASRPGYLCWISMSCSVMSSGGPISQEPAFTALRKVGGFAPRARWGSARASICSGRRPGTNPRGANIFMFSSKKGVASLMPCSTLSAM